MIHFFAFAGFTGQTDRAGRFGPISRRRLSQPCRRTSPWGGLRRLPARALRKHVLPLLVASLILPACTRYDIELYDDGLADIRLTNDWLTHYHEYPEGMTLLLAKDGDAFTYFDATNNVGGQQLHLSAGDYKLTILNRTFGEFGTMQFYQRNSHDALYAISNTWTQEAEQAWDEGRIYLEEPEHIGVAVDTFSVPHTLDDLVFRPWRDAAPDLDIHLELPETVYPMTTTLNVRCKVINIQYMQSVEGYIAGLADGFLLNQWWRRTQTGTIKLERWRTTDRHWEHSGAPAAAPGAMRADRGTSADSLYTGWISTSIETFGLPHGRELLRWRTPESNLIVLHFTLIDGSAVDFTYPVGKLIRYVGDDGESETFDRTDVTLQLDLELTAPFISEPVLPYSQPEGTGQFDAEVQPWDDEEDIDIAF